MYLFEVSVKLRLMQKNLLKDFLRKYYSRHQEKKKQSDLFWNLFPTFFLLQSIFIFITIIFSLLKNF